MPQTAFFFDGDDFQIRQCGLQHRIPVHQPLAAINQTFLIQPHEYFCDRLTKRRIHGEQIALPIHRGTEAAHLFGDHAAGLFFPPPHSLDEFIAAKIETAFSHGIQLAFDHHLRGDAGVIRARLPQGVEAAHAMEADQGIHDGVLKRMAHVQGAGDIGRRDDDGIGRPLTAGREIARGFPLRINARFDIGWRKRLIHAWHAQTSAVSSS